MSTGQLQGKRVVVIGGSSGIGFAVAQRVIDAGAHVVIGSSDLAKVEAACVSLGADAIGVVVDVRDEDSVSAFFETAGPFDHLVFTAGGLGIFPHAAPHGRNRSRGRGVMFSRYAFGGR